jgi:hypothetical protein
MDHLQNADTSSPNSTRSQLCVYRILYTNWLMLLRKLKTPDAESKIGTKNLAAH